MGINKFQMNFMEEIQAPTFCARICSTSKVKLAISALRPSRAKVRTQTLLGIAALILNLKDYVGLKKSFQDF